MQGILSSGAEIAFAFFEDKGFSIDFLQHNSAAELLLLQLEREHKGPG